MSMLNLRRDKSEKPEPKMPRAATVPAAPVRAPREYDPQALNFAQRIIDTEVEIERLKIDGDQWRSRALAAEENCKRLEMRLDRDKQDADKQFEKTIDYHDRERAKLEEQRHREVDKLTEERDFYKLKFARTVERLHVAGKIILDALSTDTSEIKPPPNVDLSAIAAELEKPTDRPSAMQIEAPEELKHDAAPQTESGGAS